MSTQVSQRPSLSRGRNARSFALLAVLGAILLGSSGCRTTDPIEVEFVPPRSTTAVRYSMGSPLSGPVRSEAAGDPPADLAPGSRFVQLAWVAVEGAPEWGQGIGADARVVRDLSGESNFGTVARLALGTTWGVDPEGELSDALPAAGQSSHADALGRTVVLRRESLLVLPGTTTEASIEQKAGGVPERPGTARWDRAKILLYAGRDTEKVSVALSFEGVFVPRPDDGALDDPSATMAPAATDELILLDGLQLGGAGADRFLIFFPAREDESGQRSRVICEVSLEEGAADADIERAFAVARAQLFPPAPDSPTSALGPTPTKLGPTIEGLTWTSTQRQALLRLATLSDSELAQDTALVASAQLLSDLAAPLRKNLESQKLGDSIDPDQLALALERELYRVLSVHLDAGELGPAMESVLIRHAGQVARQPASLDEVVSRAGSRQALQDLLYQENVIYLQDSSPAARVRAFEWLERKGRAPAGYDPMASFTDRRVALQKALYPSDKPEEVAQPNVPPTEETGVSAGKAGKQAPADQEENTP